MNNVALYYESEAYSLNGEIQMGRQSAGAAFLRAIAQAAPSQIWCFARAPNLAQQCEQLLKNFGAGSTNVHWISFLDVKRLAEPGLLFRPDPGIVSDAWRRLNHSNPRDFSICGITHTTASHSVMEALASVALAPLEDWDAIVCTSRAVRDTVRHVIEGQVDYLRERLAAARFTMPQMPVIPLGVHSSDYVFTDDQRASARQELGIEPDEVVFLFVGRLSYLDKAHPVPMYLGLEACAQDRKVTLIQAGWFANEETEQAIKKDAQSLSPSVRCIFVDARDPAARGHAWAAADVFTSLSDNVQETFGLTPLEAMASGLPVVVTDWDGYKDTVRDGIDGFRIPTLAMPPGTGAPLADRYDLRMDTYVRYCGFASQLTAVNVTLVAAAYRRLAADAGLRRKMGEAARERARSEFDWAVVFQRYVALWQDLAERRRAAPALYHALTRRRRPDRSDPFQLFASYPTAAISPATRFRLMPGMTPGTAHSRRNLGTTEFASALTPNPEVIDGIIRCLQAGEWARVTALKASGIPTSSIESALLWLAKVGVLQFAMDEGDRLVVARDFDEVLESL